MRTLSRPIKYLCICWLAVSGAANADAGALSFELNSVAQVESHCRATFVVVNTLGAKLARTAIEVGVFDDKNVFSEMVVFDLGSLPQNKTKVVQFDLARDCASISRLLLNSIKECVGADNAALQCEDRIKTSNNSSITFGQ